MCMGAPEGVKGSSKDWSWEGGMGIQVGTFTPIELQVQGRPPAESHGGDQGCSDSKIG